MTELWNICNYKPFLVYLLIPFLICLITQLVYSFLVKVIIHEVLVNYGWNLMLWLLYWLYVLYVMHLSPSIVHDLVFALALWSFYPLVYKLYNQNPKKPILLNCVLWDCVGLFFCSLRTISGTNIFGTIAEDEDESLLSLGYSSFNWFWEVDLNWQIIKTTFQKIVHSGY